MILYNEKKEELNNHVNDDLRKLNKIKRSYEDEISLYNGYTDNLEFLIKKNLKNKKKIFCIKDKLRKQIDFLVDQNNKIDEDIRILNEIRDSYCEDLEVLNSKFEVKIVYNGKLCKYGFQDIRITYGFGENWNNTMTLPMIKTAAGHEIAIKTDRFEDMMFCFSNNDEIWDNNNRQDYKLNIQETKKTVEAFSSQIINEKERIINNIETYNKNIVEIDRVFFNNSIYDKRILLEYNEIQTEVLFNKNFQVENIEQIEQNTNSCEDAKDVTISQNLQTIESTVQGVNEDQNSEKKTIQETTQNATEETTAQEFELKDNGTLLISEIQNKVVLPYTAEEVKKAVESGEYSDVKSAIQGKFERPLSEFKNMYKARTREIYKLLIEREGYNKLQASEMALEIFKKRYLHPAIIAACKNLDELDVYLDCLDKNELDDFKIFKIEYELYPTEVGEKNLSVLAKNTIKKVSNFFNKMFSKKEEKNT